MSLQDRSLWPQTEALSTEDFNLDSHRRIYRRMAAMVEDGCAPDLPTLGVELADELDAIGGPAYLGALLDHALPEKFSAYMRQMREASKARRYKILCERLVDATETDRRLEIIQQTQDVLNSDEARTDANQLIVIRGDSASEKPLRWLWKPYLPMGKLVHFGGNSRKPSPQ